MDSAIDCTGITRATLLKAVGELREERDAWVKKCADLTQRVAALVAALTLIATAKRGMGLDGREIAKDTYERTCKGLIAVAQLSLRDGNTDALSAYGRGVAVATARKCSGLARSYTAQNIGDERDELARLYWNFANDLRDGTAEVPR